MNEIIHVLHSGAFSCVIENKGEMRTFAKRGVADLFYLLNNYPDFLDGASIADKVVGKGAAALMVLGKIKNVYADVISLPALTLLREAGYHDHIQFEEVVPFIQNRDATGSCPVEAMCRDEKSVDAMYSLIEDFINKINTSNPISI